MQVLNLGEAFAGSFSADNKQKADKLIDAIVKGH
jgi:hypothetical protein